MNNAILIDPETKTISPLHDFTDDLQYHYRTIGNGCRTIDIQSIGDLPNGNSVDMVIDDECRFNADLKHAFRFATSPEGQGIMNRAIICIGNGSTGSLEPIPDSLFGLIFNLIAGQIQWLDASELDEPRIEIISF